MFWWLHEEEEETRMCVVALMSADRVNERSIKISGRLFLWNSYVEEGGSFEA